MCLFHFLPRFTKGRYGKQTLKTKSKWNEAAPALDLVEEAVHILRSMPAGMLSAYFIGNLPFALGFLYFLAEMSHSASAGDHLFEYSFFLAWLYLWMKSWQAVFSVWLISWLAGAESSSHDLFSFRKVLHLVKLQVIIQPHQIYVLPLSLLALAWPYAFFQSVTAMGDGSSDIRTVLRRSWQLAQIWPFQNYRIILILSMFLVVVILNVAVLIVFLPSLIQWLSGVETPFSLSKMYLLLNTTYLSVVVIIGWLCMSPLSKVVYVLRCFYGESRKSGIDLLAEFRRVTGAEASFGMPQV